MRTELTYVKRCSSVSGVEGIAPFINGKNVWDIPTAQWTPEVQAAITHAYELGYQDMQSAVMRINVPYGLSTLGWVETKEAQ